MSSKKDRFKLIPAVYLILRKNDEVLLLQRANTGYQDGLYSMIAGHLDGDELATVGMVREAKEEAAIEINPKDLQLVHTTHRLTRGTPGQERIDLFFEAREWRGTITNVEPEKCDDLSWHPIDNLPANMSPYIRRVLAYVREGTAFSEYTIEPE